MVERIRREREAKARGEFPLDDPSVPGGTGASPREGGGMAVAVVRSRASAFVGADGSGPVRFPLPGRGVAPGEHHNSLGSDKHRAFLKAYVR